MSPLRLPGRRLNKYGARATVVDGIRFASQREGKRYRELRLLETAGLIRDLELQPRWSLDVNGQHIGNYTGDFAYTDAQTGERIIEDAKSPATKKARDYGLRIKLLKALHGIQVREV